MHNRPRDWRRPPTAVRAYTTRPDLERKEPTAPPGRPPRLVVVDTETTTGLEQRLRFAVARVYQNDAARLVAHGADPATLNGHVDPYAYRCIAEYVAVPLDLDSADRQVIEDYFNGRTRIQPMEGTIAAPRVDGDRVVNEAGAPIRPLSVDGLRHLILRLCWEPEAKRRRREQAAMLVAFNAPFDLARLAADAGPSTKRAGAFSFVFARAPDGSPSRYRPRLVVSKMGVKAHLMTWTDADDASGSDANGFFRGHVLDPHVLAWSLFSRSMSLGALAARLKTPHPKLEAKEHGTALTPDYLHYARQDVVVTIEVLVELLKRFDRHPLSHEHPGRPALEGERIVQPEEFGGWVVPGRLGADGKGRPMWRGDATQDTRMYSPASLAKGYLATMGVEPPLGKFTGFPIEVLSYAMAAFFGARSECRVRRVVVPVVYTDVLSMYPTVNCLLRTWDLITAAEIDVRECTAEVQQFLENVEVADLFDPSTWSRLYVFAELVPDNDILPVRAHYEPDAWGIGVNPLRSTHPRWYALTDLVASRLLTGRAPRIRRALRLVPVGVQEGLCAVKVGAELEVSPEVDLFQRVIELRKSTRDPDADLALKIVANSGAYGVFVEFVRSLVFNPVPLEVHSGESHVQVETLHPEVPGRYGFPPVGVMITAAARLVLAMIERCVSDLGGTIAFCDTDSAAVVSTELGGLVPCPGGPHRLLNGDEALLALSWDQVEKIRRRFDSLKPYDPDLVPNDVLELEAVNFAPCAHCTGHGCDRCRKKGVDRDRRQQLYAYVVSAKRYALFNLDCADPNRPAGTWSIQPPIYRKISEHGLGHVLDPRDPVGEADERHRRNDAVPTDAREETAEVAAGVYVGELPPHRRWIVDAWDWMVRRDGLGHLDLELPTWTRNVAVSQLRISTPEILRAFRDWNVGRPYPEQIKPFGFLLACHPDPLTARTVPPVEDSLLWNAPDTWRALSAYVRGRGGLGRGDYSRDMLPPALYRKAGVPPDVLAVEMPYECPDAHGLWDPEDGADAMLDALWRAHEAHERLNSRRQGTRARMERDFDPAHFQLVAPMEHDPFRWLEMPWVDRWSGRPFRITTKKPSLGSDSGFSRRIVVRTVEDVLVSYLRNPESKSLDPVRDVPCTSESRGLLRRRPVIAEGSPHLIGKEANDLEERRAGHRSEADSMNTYGRNCEGCGRALEDGSDPRRRFHGDACRMRADRLRRSERGGVKS